MTKMRTGYFPSLFSVTLLTLGLFASTLVGCAGSLVRQDDTLAGYRLELARLVEVGVLTNDDAEKFYGIASLEMERRAKQRAEQRQGQPAGESGGAVNRPSFGHFL
jgi:hypothetical protein